MHCFTSCFTCVSHACHTEDDDFDAVARQFSEETEHCLDYEEDYISSAPSGRSGRGRASGSGGSGAAGVGKKRSRGKKVFAHHRAVAKAAEAAARKAEACMGQNNQDWFVKREVLLSRRECQDSQLARQASHREVSLFAVLLTRCVCLILSI